MNIYIDIDGVLVHDSLKNNGALANGALELLKYLTQNHNCFWLTTHCRGGENHAVEYLNKKFFSDETAMLEKIKMTDWGAWKTDAIDFSQDFRWLDDDTYSLESEALKAHQCEDKLIKVNLHQNSNQLVEILKHFNS